MREGERAEREGRGEAEGGHCCPAHHGQAAPTPQSLAKGNDGLGVGKSTECEHDRHHAKRDTSPPH